MRIRCGIENISSLLCNRFSDEQALIATEGTRGSSRGDRGTQREIAESKLYLDEKGRPCIPQAMMLACIVDGGVWHKIGKKQVTTQKSSLLYSCLDIPQQMIPIEFKQPWSVDQRPVVIPATKGRILTYRPRFDDWKLHFELMLEHDIIGVKLLRQIVDDAGMRSGIGDNRPNRKGPCGKFKVILWEVVREEHLKQAAE